MAQPRTNPVRAVRPGLLTLGLLLIPMVGAAQSSRLPYPEMTARIVEALDPDSGEFAIIRYDPTVLRRFYSQLREALEQRGVEVQTLRYGVITGFYMTLHDADIYIWLPASPSTVPRPEQRTALRQWLEEGRGRQVHFHWGAGTRGIDGGPGEHSPAYDQVYADALDIDYAALDQHQNAAIAVLHSKEVRITTPAGTDIRFRIGDRRFNKQNGDASKRHMESARTRVDREIELPAGVLRVAPIEKSVEGTIVVPWARFENTEVRDLRLEFDGGKIKNISASTGEAAVRAAIDAAPVLNHFREFALGFNPKLKAPPGDDWVPYYGYGAGVVRLSLGNNTELGGDVDGEGDQRFAFRWFFFRDATVTVGKTVVVDGGELVLSP